MPRRLDARSLGPVLLSLFAIALAAATWNTWADCFYDFGSQLYFPWQITLGRRMYADIAYFNGPLSPYLCAAEFRLFGVGLSTLVWCNLAVLAATVVVLYRLVGGYAGPVGAAAGGLIFVGIFAFGQYVGIGNYNWVCPYTHEATHGVSLALAAIAGLGRWGRTGRRRWLLASGMLLGLTLLTKAEIAGPAVIAMAVGVPLFRRAGRFSPANSG